MTHPAVLLVLLHNLTQFLRLSLVFLRVLFRLVANDVTFLVRAVRVFELIFCFELNMEYAILANLS